MRVLVVEDNPDLLRVLKGGLEQAGHPVDLVSTADEAQAALATTSYAAMILDLGLPDQDGLTLLGELRANGLQLPVLVLTARVGLHDRVRGLRKGADDYLGKPFAMEELVARLQALLRRPGALLPPVLTIGDLSLDIDLHSIRARGEPIALKAKEAMLLELLMRRAGQVVPKRIAEDQLFGAGGGSANAVEVYVHRLRKALADATSEVRIHTVRGVGYLLTDAAL